MKTKVFQQEKQSRQTFHNYCISTITRCVCEASGCVCFFFYLALPWDSQRNVLGLWVCDVFTKRLKLLTHREPRWFSWTRLSSFLWRGSSFFFSLSPRSPFELPVLSYTLPFILISNLYSLLFTVVLSSSLHSKRNKINSKRKEKIHISATQS